jgi:hypothetical protein
MNEQNALEKNKRCPKGFVRNKEGVCVPKVTKQTDIIDNTTPTKVPKEKVPKEKVPKEPVTTNTVNKRKKVSPKAKTMKKMTKIDAIELLTERRECIKNIRNNLTIIH